MIEINRETMKEEIRQRLISIFSLPETRFAMVKKLYIPKTTDRETLEDLAAEAVARCYHDFVSDIDIHVHVGLPPETFVDPEEYLSRIDRFGFDGSCCLGKVFVKDSSMYRIILKNGMRYDFIFDLTEDPHAEKLFLLPPAEDTTRPTVKLWPAENIDRFWFESGYALTRLYRDHYLQADQQANLLLNETLILQGTPTHPYNINFRRRGSQDVPEYSLADPNACPYRTDIPGFSHIAGKIYTAAVTYDRLITRRSPAYPQQHQNLFAIWEAYHQNYLERMDILPSQIDP